jgi:hypothetical protein
VWRWDPSTGGVLGSMIAESLCRRWHLRLRDPPATGPAP